VLTLIEEARELPARRGVIRGAPALAFQAVRGNPAEPLPPHRSAAEQSNTSILYGSRLILKMFRHLESGPNMDCEIGDYLTNTVHFAGVPPFAGSIEYAPANGERSTVAMLQGLVENAGDAWKWAQEELRRYYETCASLSFPES